MAKKLLTLNKFKRWLKREHGITINYVYCNSSDCRVWFVEWNGSENEHISCRNTTKEYDGKSGCRREAVRNAWENKAVKFDVELTD